MGWKLDLGFRDGQNLVGRDGERQLQPGESMRKWAPEGESWVKVCERE